MGCRTIGFAVVVLALTVPCKQARSQPALPAEPSPTHEPRPWAKGTSESEQALAFELYRAGNAEFAKSRFAEAFVKYREAIRHWDHPAIRYNMAICLMNLDALVEAKDNLDRSLAYGDSPLGTEHYEQGLRLRARLAAQLATLEITSQEPGTDVALDGELLFRAPGGAHAVVMPGLHQVVANGPGLPMLSHSVILVAGTATTLMVEHKVKLVGGDIRHVLEIEELPAKPGRDPLPGTPDAQTRPPAAPQPHPLAPPPSSLQARRRPTSITWEAGVGYGSAWAHSGGDGRALFNVWSDVVAGTRRASTEWSDPIAAWSFGLGGGRWVRDNVALSGRFIWTTFGFSDGTRFDLKYLGSGLQYWPTDHLWLGGGLGYARTDSSPGDESEQQHSRSGFGQDLRAGCTFNIRSKLTFNISAELTSMIFNTTLGPEVATMAVLLGIQPSMALGKGKP
jgi:hypothetical protein